MSPTASILIRLARFETDGARLNVANEAAGLARLGLARPGPVLRLLPTAFLVGCAWALAWETLGSFDVADWLSYATACGLVLAVVLLFGAAARPATRAAVVVALLAALAGWTAISLDWSPAPSSARDEALLVALYAVVFALPLLTLRGPGERLAATALVVCGLGSLALATALEVRLGSHPANFFTQGRLAFPVTYPNALAAMLLIGFWPAIGLAAERRLPAVVRAVALGGAVAMVSDLLLAQSKGGAIALAVSGVVFFCVCPGRLRALVPTLAVAALIGAEARPLTAPYRASSADLIPTMRHGGAVVAVLAGLAFALGVVYAFADRRVDVSQRARRIAAALVVAGAVAALGGGVGTFLVTVDRPGHFFTRQWRSFKHLPTKQRNSTHFFALGSNRYDFWRVALDEFRDHPLAGIGARGFYSAYLVEGRSSETPERAHSLELDVLSETGIVGFVFLLGAGVLVFWSLWPGARRSVAGAGLLAAGAYFVVHTAVDWVWTIPEVGLPAFTLAGIGASTASRASLRGRVAVPAGVVTLAVAVVGFAPPWLSARFVDRAYEAGSLRNARDDLRWARRLDPLSTDPYVAEAEVARSPADIPPLQRAVAKEPRQENLRYLLGTAYLRAGRKADARRELREALRLFPDDDLAKAALEKAG